MTRAPLTLGPGEASDGISLEASILYHENVSVSMCSASITSKHDCLFPNHWLKAGVICLWINIIYSWHLAASVATSSILGSQRKPLEQHFLQFFSRSLLEKTGQQQLNVLLAQSCHLQEKTISNIRHSHSKCSVWNIPFYSFCSRFHK